MCGKKGFTLVEILFVLIIMAGIVAYAVPAYKRSQERAQYERALGTLVSINNAVKALERDLATEGLTFSFPAQSSFEIQGMQTTAETHQTPAQWISAGGSDAEKKDKRFMAVLWELKYLDNNFRNDDNTLDSSYTFYARNNKDSNICEGNCPKGTVVCMCQTDTSDTSGCFYGASITRWGEITRLKTDDCTSNS